MNGPVSVPPPNSQGTRIATASTFTQTFRINLSTQPRVVANTHDDTNSGEGYRTPLMVQPVAKPSVCFYSGANGYHSPHLQCPDFTSARCLCPIPDSLFFTHFAGHTVRPQLPHHACLPKVRELPTACTSIQTFRINLSTQPRVVANTHDDTNSGEGHRTPLMVQPVAKPSVCFYSGANGYHITSRTTHVPSVLS